MISNPCKDFLEKHLHHIPINRGFVHTYVTALNSQQTGKAEPSLYKETTDTMEVIVFEKDAFWKLQEDLMKRFEQAMKTAHKPEDDWIPLEEAKRLLNVKSKTTMQELRDHNKIVFTQPSKKVILYSRASIKEYIKKA